MTTIRRERGFGYIQDEHGEFRFFHADGLYVGGVEDPEARRAAQWAAFKILPEGVKVEFEPVIEPGRPEGKNLRARLIKVL